MSARRNSTHMPDSKPSERARSAGRLPFEVEDSRTEKKHEIAQEHRGHGRSTWAVGDQVESPSARSEGLLDDEVKRALPAEGEEYYQHHLPPRPRAMSGKPQEKEKRSSRRHRTSPDRSSGRPRSPDRIYVADSRMPPIVAKFAQRISGEDNAEHHINNLELQLRKRDEAYRDMKTSYQELRTECRELRDKIATKDRQIAALQQIQFSGSLGSHFPPAEDDDSIRTKIEALLSSVKMWAQRYALPDEALTKMSFLKPFQDLRDSYVLPDAGKASSVTTGYPITLLAPRVLLHAELITSILHSIVQNPFISLEYAGSFSPAQKMYDAYKVAESEDKRSANTWRAQTVRLLLADSRPPSAVGQNTIDNSSYACRRRCYERFIEGFLNSRASVLLEIDRREDVEARRMNLFDVVHDIGEFFSKLWSQNPRIVHWGLQAMERKDFTRFSMVPHQALRLEDNDVSLDHRRKVWGVIQPAILAFGNEHGENYDQCKVWSKAVVWLSPAPNTLP